MVILSGVTLPRACFETCWKLFEESYYDSIVGSDCWYLSDRGYFILFDNFDITWSVYGKNINYN